MFRLESGRVGTKLPTLGAPLHIGKGLPQAREQDLFGEGADPKRQSSPTRRSASEVTAALGKPGCR